MDAVKIAVLTRGTTRRPATIVDDIKSVNDFYRNLGFKSTGFTGVPQGTITNYYNQTDRAKVISTSQEISGDRHQRTICVIAEDQEYATGVRTNSIHFLEKMGYEHIANNP